ncbi:hypothetical protein HIM_05125 [Hirsutella minnesotensis 3608]|uniref:Uncharacterized protein n=1 Tax=Hirsutella minnesotensis 3608 TaxID=1043627 RepID=A0A0F8A5J3_9HYPO|nr:hypothetical protein HIM_05125 [Hirsutella minnesotensis 3608]
MYNVSASVSHIFRANNVGLPVTFNGLWNRFFPLLVALFPVFIYYLRLNKTRSAFAPVHNASTEDNKVKKRKPPIARPGSTEHYRKLFFQLQNLESYPGALETAREELLSMLSHGLSVALRQPDCNSSSILNIATYSAEKMDTFLKDTHERMLSDWTNYLERRKQGHGPELFATADEAKVWLVQQAPVKFLDGAWLGHIHKITTPFAFRSVTRLAWQILSEELGDGDPDKHHVNLYCKLLESIGCPLPNGHSADFINACEWERDENRGAWRAAVGQLAISLFPNEFLPEILGFNLHFEMASLETMQVAHELKGLGIDPCYFLLHITIDNADSGHTAMAAHTVRRYIDVVRETESEAAVQQAWKRVQVGYVLSQSLGDYSHLSVVERDSPNPDVLFGALGAEVMDLFRSKALVSHRMHSQGRVRVGPYALNEWLEATLRKDSNDLHLLTTLSQAKPWVYAGASRKSLLVRELSWGGRMFGAFTKNEVTTICRWIDALKPKRGPWLYWKFAQRHPVTSQEAVAELQDPAYHHPFLPVGNNPNTPPMTEKMFQEVDYRCIEALAERPALKMASPAQLPDIIALWFTHISLLENTITIPSRTTDRIYMSILRLLRAQSGFGIEDDIVAGMDEARRDDCTSLVDIGMELTKKLSKTAVSAKPQTLRHVFLLVASHGQGEDSFELVNDMLQWRARPTENLGFLLGAALASVDFKRAVWKSPDLLSQRSRLALETIIERETVSLVECARQLQSRDDALYRDLLRGHYVVKSIMSRCI